MQETSVLLSLAAVFAAALVSPGPDVALVVRTAVHQAAAPACSAPLGWPAASSSTAPWCSPAWRCC